MRRLLLVCTLAALACFTSPVYAAGITVDTNVDGAPANDGHCTLREAIDNANAHGDTTGGDCAPGSSGANVITFDNNYVITLTGGELPGINTDVTITGNGWANTTIQASQCDPTTTGCTPAAYRVFNVGSGGALTLNNLTVQHGNCPSSGSTCSGDATNKLRGGGIYNGGTLNLSGVTVSANAAVIGGAISSAGSLTVDGSLVTLNSAMAYGGGIYDDSGATLTVRNSSVISANHAGQSGGGVSHFSAGAITIDHSAVGSNTSAFGGGGIYQSGGTLTVQNGSIIGGGPSGNRASGSGGGIMTYSGTAIIDASTVSGNAGQTGGGIETWGSLTVQNNSLIGGAHVGNISIGIGGGINGETGSTITIDHSKVDGNEAPGSAGGGIASAGTLNVVNGSAIGEAGAGNLSSISGGGGILVAGGMTTVDASTVSYNSDDGIFVSYPTGTTLHVQHGSLIVNNGGIDGGGIYNESTTVIDASTVSGNTAVAPTVSNNGGGGIFNFSGTLTIQNSSVIGGPGVGEGNTAPTSTGGGIFNMNTFTGAVTNITASCITGNTDMNGVSLVNQAVTTQTATGNWWGAADGPNPPGGGDAVSAGWDTSGFLTKPTLGCGGGPTGLSASAGGADAIDLSWTDNASDESGFSLERSPNGSGGWSVVATPAADSTGATDGGLDCNTEYFYRVQAVRTASSQTSAYSLVADATTGACPLIQASPSPLAFGAVVVGHTSAPVMVTVTNHGAADVTVDPVAAPADFSVTTGCNGAVLIQNATCSFDVTFKPGTPGTKSGTVTISTTGGNTSVSLSGTGLSKIAAPKLTSPKNGALEYTQKVKLSWASVKGARGYRVEVGTDSGFVNPLVQFANPSTATFTTRALPFGIYFWHVATKDAFGQGDYSAPWRFEVTLNKTPKKNAALANGLVKFAWQVVKGKSYLLEYSSDPTFPVGPLTTRLSTGKTATYTIPKAKALAGGGTFYYWHVSVDGGATWTPYWTFKVK